ncbi:MAG TPA: transcriptional repressor [Coriobacteriia bacterium]|nr:transcriptional repressor [Coriobacteriia bacterium]
MAADDNDSHFGTGRITGRRRAIAAAADALGGAFTVDDLVKAARSVSPGIGVATVYRAVAVMESCGSLERVGTRESSVLYTRCDHADHHHHLVCTNCGKVARAGCPLPPSVQVDGTEGFTITNHELRLYGLCAACVEAGSAESAARSSNGG